jgi:hypothetical protein
MPLHYQAKNATCSYEGFTASLPGLQIENCGKFECKSLLWISAKSPSAAITQAILLKFIAQGPWRDAQHLGGLGLVARIGSQRL